MNRFIFTLTFLLIIHVVPAQEQQIDRNTFNLHFQQGYTDYAQQDYQGFLDHMLAAYEINPASYNVIYNISCGYSLTGQHDKAINTLNKIAEEKGIYFETGNDSDFDAIRELEGYKDFKAKADKMNIPINTSELFFASQQIDFSTEGMAYDPTMDRFFFGSMRNGTIMTVDVEGNLLQFTEIRHDDKLLPVLGLEVDSKRNLLWAVGRLNSQEHGRMSGAFGFDLQTGEQKHAFVLPKDSEHTGFNDLTVSNNGDIYLTGGPLYIVKEGTSNPVPWPHGEVTGNANGICFSDDESTLFVADYVLGIFAIDMASGKVQLIKAPENLPTVAIDGLYFYNGSLVGVQNGIPPWRALQFYLSDDYSQIMDHRIIERNNTKLLTAMTGAIVEDDFFMIGFGAGPTSRPQFISGWGTVNLGPTIILKALLK